MKNNQSIENKYYYYIGLEKHELKHKSNEKSLMYKNEMDILYLGITLLSVIAIGVIGFTLLILFTKHAA